MQIRGGQIDSMKDARRADFERRLILHLSNLFPRHFAGLSETETGIIADKAIAHAFAAGFRTESSVARFAELRCYFGAEFDQDTQTAGWLPELLARRPEQDERLRSQALHDEGMRQWALIAGPENSHLRRALGRIGGDPVRLLKAAVTPSLPSALAVQLENVYPEKASALGTDTLHKFISQAALRAQALGLASEPGQALYAGLAFALGIGFASDPLYPWAGAVFQDTALRDERSRALRLIEQGRAFLARWSS